MIAIHLAMNMSDNLSTQILPEHSEKAETIRFQQREFQVLQSLGHDNFCYAWLVRDTGDSPAELQDAAEPKEPETPAPPALPLVLKTIVGSIPRDPAYFEREFQTLARLDHPGLARFKQLEITPDSISYTREHADGLDFLSYVHRPATERERQDLYIRLNDGESPHLHTTDTDLDLLATPTPSNRSSIVTPSHTDANGEPTTLELDFSDLEPLHASHDADHLTQDASESHDATPNTLPPSNSDEPAPLDLIFLRLEHVLPQLLSALEYLHRFRRAHGNLKSSTIQIDANGTLRLSDYGLRKHLQPTNTQPEIADSRQALALEQAEDLYALGCLLFDAIAPPPAPDTSEPRTEHRRDSLLTVQPLCPAGWIELVQELLHPQADHRPDLQQIRRLIENSSARSVALPPTQIDEQSTFFGRNDVLDTLLEINKKTTTNRSMNLVLLTGPVGVGKAALLDLLAYRSAQAGWLVLRGACYQGDVTLYQGFSEIAEQLARTYKQLPENVQHKLAPIARRAARLFPCLSPDNQPFSPINPASSNATQPPCTTAARLFAIDALRQLLATIAEQRPILIGIDNLQHASPDTIALLADIAGQPQSLRCTIAASTSSNPLETKNHPVAIAFRHAPLQPEIIDVPCFTRREARHYILGAARSLPLIKQKEILKKGHLHPLLIDELIFEQQRLTSATNPRNAPVGQLELNITDPSAPPTQPQGTSLRLAEIPSVSAQLKNIYKTRLASLSRAERLVLQLLTVASAPLSAELITKVLLTELGSQQFAGQSGALIAEKLVRLRLAHRQSTLQHSSGPDTSSESDAPQNANYLPPHDICRQIVLDDIGRDHRAHLCSLIADALSSDTRSQRAPRTIDLRFEYLLRATRTNDALDASSTAAHSAEQRFSFHRAAQIWRWHLENTNPKRIQSSDCLTHLARVEARAGNFEQAAHHYQSLSTALQTPDKITPENQIQRAYFHLYEADAWLRAGHANNAVSALNQALAIFSERYTSNVLSGTITGLKVSLLSTFNRSRLPASRLHDTRANAATAAERTRAEIYRFAIDYNAFLHSARGRSMQNRLARLARKTHDTYLNALDRVWLTPELHVPAISFASESPHADLSADLALSATLFEQIDDARGLATVAYTNGLRNKRLCQFDAAAQHFERAATQSAHASIDESSQEYRIAYASARLQLDQGNLDSAEKIARQLLHTHRNDHLAELRAYQILTDIFLLRGQIDEAAACLHHTSTNAAALDSSFAHIEIARQSAHLNIAKGRPEVAAGHLDMLVDQLQSSRLASLPPVRILVELTLGQALAALLERQRILEEPRQLETTRRLARSIAELRTQRKIPVTPTLAAEIARLRARYELLRNRPLKALRELTSAEPFIQTINTSLETARHAEARAIITLRIDKLDKADARAALESSRLTYTRLGCSLPLILEGWPSTRSTPVFTEDHV